MTTVKNSLRLTVSREDQPIIKDLVEDFILELEPIRFILVRGKSAMAFCGARLLASTRSTG